MWEVHDTNGMLRMLKVPAYWIPQAKVQLLSITSLLQTYDKEKIVCESHCLKLNGDPSDPTKGAVVANIDLPTTVHPKALTSTITEVHCSSYNLSEPEKELLHWHQHLGHLSMKCVQFLMQIGALSSSGATQPHCSLQDKTSTQVCCMPVWQADKAFNSWQPHQLSSS